MNRRRILGLAALGPPLRATQRVAVTRDAASFASV